MSICTSLSTVFLLISLISATSSTPSAQMMSSIMTSSPEDVSGSGGGGGGEEESLADKLRCFRRLQESGQKLYIIPFGNTMRIFDISGEEVSCDHEIQRKIRQRSDRRCMFSPIHCLFNKRIQTVKMLAKMHGNGGLYAVRRRR